MSNAALAPELSPAPSRQVRGAHARAERTVEVRVIPGGLIAEERGPHHAKPSVRETLRGVGYGLSARERATAIGGGIVFALASLAAVLVGATW